MRFCLALALIAGLAAPSGSQTATSVPRVPSQRQTVPDQRGLPQSPLIVTTGTTKEEPTQAAKDREDKAANDRKLVEFTRNLVTATYVLGAIAVLQLFVFGFQAIQLMRTVTRMREAEKITAESVGEMRRAAHAAEQTGAAAKKNAEASLLALRPWVSCDAEVIGPLTYRENGDVNVPLRFTLANKGRSPAMGIRFNHWFTLWSPAHEHAVFRQEQLARLLKQFPPKVAEQGLLLFPGAAEIQHIHSLISREEILKATADIPTTRNYLPVLVGFLTYSHPLGAERADTGFMYELRKIHASAQSGFGFELDEPVPLDNLRLVPHSMWPGYAT